MGQYWRHTISLPEGNPDAQVLQGVVTLSYPSLVAVMDRYDEAKEALKTSQFAVVQQVVQDENTTTTALEVTDPWGTGFRIIEGEPQDRDARGEQPGGRSEGHGMCDLTFFTPKSCNLVGIGRFYSQILGAPVISCNDQECAIAVGPRQTLRFVPHPEGKNSGDVAHDDLRDEQVQSPAGFPNYLSNYGPHISMYVADLATTYQRAAALNVVYVNPRFKRRAYTLDEALQDCMFRCLDIVDPANPAEGIILRLEHEIRSVVKPDGTLYKSCPFDAIPEVCRT